jgi:hypothetical protein
MGEGRLGLTEMRGCPLVVDDSLQRAFALSYLFNLSIITYHTDLDSSKDPAWRK